MSKTNVPDLISEYHRACLIRDRASAALEDAQKRAGEIKEKIAKALAPADIQRGEAIGIWARGSDDVERCYVVKRAARSHLDCLTLEIRSTQRFAEKDEDQP